VFRRDNVMEEKKEGEKKTIIKELMPIKVKSLKDLARLAASVVMMGQSAYILKYVTDDGKIIFGFLAVFRDFYNLYGIPLLYYYVDDYKESLDGNFILVKTEERGERVEVSKGGSRPGWISIPLISLAEKPAFFPKELK